MSWVIEPAIEAFPSHAAEWDRLNAELCAAHPFLDSRFIGPLLVYFGSGDELLCMHHDGGVIDAALILRPLGWRRWALFLPGQAQIGPLLCSKARVLESLFEALPGYAWSIDLLAIDPDYAPDWSGLRLPHLVRHHALTMAINISGGFDDYWQTRPGQLRKNLRRYRQRSEKQFTTRKFNVIAEPQQIAAAVKRYGEIESSGWKGKAGTAINANNLQGRFYVNVLKGFAEQGQAKICELLLDEKTVASRLLICNDKMVIILKTTYDETLASIAPGRQHLLETLQHFFSEKQQSRIEFYTNANRDQAEWASSLRFIRHHQIFRNESLAGLYAYGQFVRNGLFRKKTPKAAFNPCEVSAFSTLESLPDPARELFSQAELTSPELSVEWFTNLQQTVFPGPDTVRYYLLTLRSSPVSILPLKFAKKRWRRSIEALSNFYTSLYAPILPPRGDAVDLIPLLKATLQDQPGTHVMRFAPLDPDSPSFEALLSALRSIGWIPFRYFCFGNWYLPVTQDWQSYFAALPGQLRNTIKRKGRKFAAAGGTLEIITTPDQVDRAITAFTQVYAKSWKRPRTLPRIRPRSDPFARLQGLAASRHRVFGRATNRSTAVDRQPW
jgi:hypothetical protein